MIREISQICKSLNFKNRLYKSANWIKSSVSSMTSAEEGQPPSNEPEEWQDPLTPKVRDYLTHKVGPSSLP